MADSAANPSLVTDNVTTMKYGSLGAEATAFTFRSSVGHYSLFTPLAYAIDITLP